MSGGHFSYLQHHIGDIADCIQSELNKMGKEIPREDRWHDDDWYKKYPEDKLHPTYSEETQKEFRNAIRHLKIAAVYAQRIDWFLSGDDGEETFHKELNEELNGLKANDRLVYDPEDMLLKFIEFQSSDEFHNVPRGVVIQLFLTKYKK